MGVTIEMKIAAIRYVGVEMGLGLWLRPISLFLGFLGIRNMDEAIE